MVSARAFCLRLRLGRRMAAHAEGLARELRQAVPDLVPFERAGERDAGPDALLVRRGARRVVAAEAHAPDGDALRVEVVALLDPVAHRLRRALVVAADRDVVLGLALPRPVDGERRDAAREERLLVGVQLLLRRVEPRRHDQHRAARQPAQHAEDRLALERDRHALARSARSERHAVAVALAPPSCARRASARGPARRRTWRSGSRCAARTRCSPAVSL